MKGFVYLAKKGDLYYIGHGKDLEKIRSTLKPDQIIETLYLDQPVSFEARLYRRFRKSRLPSSGYFKLSEKQLLDCKKQLGKRGHLPRSISKEFSTTFTGGILLFFISFLFLGYTNLYFAPKAGISLLVSSIPFWVLFSLGNFGGYETEDLPLFFSWINRSKALISAISISSIAFMFLYFFFRPYL